MELRFDLISVLVLAVLLFIGTYMISDTLRGGVDMASASMRYLYNKASGGVGLSTFREDEINDAERARHIEKFKETHVGGLWNEGNTCFINSVVQALSSCKPVEEFAAENKAPNNLCSSLADLILNLNQIHTATHGYSTSRLMQAIGGAERWSRLDQEDAQEFFQKLLQSLEADWKAKHPDEKAGRITPFDGDFAVRVGCLRCGDMEGIRRGVISSVDLSLEPTMTSQVALIDLLHSYCAMETIPEVECYRCSLVDYKLRVQEKMPEDGPLRVAMLKRVEEVNNALQRKVIDEKQYTQLKCNNVRMQADKTKQTMFARPLPAVLMIHINRSVFDLRTGFIRKNYAPVKFLPLLDLAQFTTDPSDPTNSDPRKPMKGTAERPEIYSLKAAVIHYGSANFGHYVCFRKFDGLWWRISDDAVDLTTEAQVLGAQGVFMLFYERTPDPSKPTREAENERL